MLKQGCLFIAMACLLVACAHNNTADSGVTRAKSAHHTVRPRQIKLFSPFHVSAHKPKARAVNRRGSARPVYSRTNTSQSGVMQPPIKPIMLHKKMHAFNQIHMEGRMNVHLHTGYKQSEVILKGDPRDLEQLKTNLSHNSLYLTLKNKYPLYGPVDVDIRTQFLNRFAYRGEGLIQGNQLNTRVLDLYLANKGNTRLSGSIGLQKLKVTGLGLVQIDGINSPNLQITLEGKPRVQLTGTARLTKLKVLGDGWLSLYWVKSDNLFIRARNRAKIQLAGIVNKLEVDLWDFAQFKGRYLRAQRSFVKTHGRSMAEVSAINHQSSLATDASDIYYFNISNTRADFMANSGSVLNMREWSIYDNENYNRYNKQFP